MCEYEIERISGDCSIIRPVQDVCGKEVERGELRLVVKHLFIMRRLPARVDGIAKKAARDLVSQALAGHLVERQYQEIVQLAGWLPLLEPQEHMQLGGHRELVLVAKASLQFISERASLLDEPADKLAAFREFFCGTGCF